MELATRDAFLAGGGRIPDGTAVLLLDDLADDTPAALGQLLEAILPRLGGATSVLRHESRTPEFACAVFDAGADDVLRLPGDLPFLKRRLAAMVRRRAVFDWPTSVDSELRLLHATR